MMIFASAGRSIEYTPPSQRAAGQTGVVTITDSNPAAHLSWPMTRGVLIRIGVRCVLAALKR